jgi:hypothetical protein
MPLAWIYELSKQQLEELAGQLGLPTDGALDDLRKRVRDKWKNIQPHLPPPGAAKSLQTMKPVQSGLDPAGYQGTPLSKVKVKLVSDLILGIPPLSSTDPEDILRFLIRVNQVVELKLLPDSEFMALLISRTSGRVMQILGAHVGTTDGWDRVQSEIISTFLPPRVKEQFLASYVLDRFQAPTEDLTAYVMSVVGAASIYVFAGTEAQLVQRMVQNLHPRVKSHCMFESRPESVRDLYSLATPVAEAVAVEEQRKRGTIPVPQGGALRQRANSPLQGEVLPAKPDSRGKCWACGQAGHFQRDCSSKTRPSSNRTSGKRQ